MKRKYVQGILFGVLLATAVSCSACGGKKDEAKKSGETVNEKETVVKKKEAVKLVLSEAKSLPDKVKEAEFSSADKKIATVTKNGVVPVSYTHLDVYKRQREDRDNRNGGNRDNRNGNRDNRNGGTRDNRNGNRDNRNSCLLYTSSCV